MKRDSPSRLATPPANLPLTQSDADIINFALKEFELLCTQAAVRAMSNARAAELATARRASDALEPLATHGAKFKTGGRGAGDMRKLISTELKRALRKGMELPKVTCLYLRVACKEIENANDRMGYTFEFDSAWRADGSAVSKRRFANILSEEKARVQAPRRSRTS